MPRSLIVMPDDTAKPTIDAIGGAVKSIRVKMFAFSDPGLLETLIQAHRRAVKIRVMLNPARHSGEIQNKGARSVLRGAGIDVLDTNPAFNITHEKSAVIDDRIALIGSMNWEPETFEKTRDYAVLTADAREIKEIIECFEADWSRQPFQPPQSSNLIWCPGTGRESLAHFIDSAEHSLFIQNERYQDAIIVEHIVRAKLRGVKVHIMTRPSHSLRAEQLVEGIGDLRIMQDMSIGIHKIKHYKLHAKMLLADRSRAIIGSINLTSGSFDKRRELAIRVTDDAILTRLNKVVHDDWEHSHPIDLTDKGLLSDLKKHPKQGGLTRLTSVATNADD
jgi:cardiolipin synthase